MLSAPGTCVSLGGTSTPIFEPVIVNGVRTGLVEAFIRSVTTHPSIWENPNLPALKWIKAVLVWASMEADDPFVKKVNQTLRKCKKMAQTRFPPRSNPVDFFHTARMKEMAIASKVASQIPTEPSKTPFKFSQNNLRIDEVKEYIEANGEKIEEIELNDVDDDLVQLIYEKCPNLTSFKLGIRLSFMRNAFTDKDLDYIAKMPLKKLDLDIWTPESLTREGLQKLLSEPQLQANLTELSLSCGLGDDQVIAPIAQFKQLNRLSIDFPFLTPLGVESLFQSPTLKESLTSLELRMAEWAGVLIANNLLQSLSQYSKLNELTLCGTWSVDANSVLNLLQARQNLIKLNFSGLAVTSDMAAKIGQFTQLQELHLDNCSLLEKDDFKLLLENKSSLQTLSLMQTGGLFDKAFKALTKLPNVRSLSLSACSGLSGLYDNGLKTLCESKSMQNNLTHLCISDDQSVTYKAWGELAKLSNLKSLSLVNCAKFNDISFYGIIQSFQPSLTKTLKEIELTQVSISDCAMSGFERFSQLQALTLNNCYAITEAGIYTFLQSKRLQQQLTRLYLNNAVISFLLLKDLEQFTALQVLIIGNPNDRRFSRDNAIFRLQNVKSNNAQVEVFDEEG